MSKAMTLTQLELHALKSANYTDKKVAQLSESVADAIEEIPGAVRYDYAQELTEEQKAQARANVGLGDISLGVASDGLMYVFINGEPVGTGIPRGQSGDVFGYVDENNTVVLNGNLADGTYTLKYEMENGNIVDIGNMVLDSTVYYSITSTLTQCTNSNGSKSIAEGNSYSATISANSGYSISSIKVTMGGTDITSSVVSGNKITIASVTGNVVITATAIEIVVPTYTITNNLTYCKNSNSATSIQEGSAYSATITANSGYELKSVSATMGGSAVTVTNGVINITSVTGNIVITAVAEEKAVTPSYTNLLPKAINADGTPYNGGKGYKSGYKMSTSSGNESATTGAYCSGFMPISNMYDIIRVKNVTLSGSANVNNFVFYDASKTKVCNVTANGSANAFHVSVEVKDGYYQLSPHSWITVNPAFFRFSCGGITDETIVTVNEEIV